MPTMIAAESERGSAFETLGELVGRASGAVGPAWFTSVMGTGILAIGIAISPVHVTGGTVAARTLFAVDLALFVLFAALFAGRLIGRPGTLAATFSDANVAQAWGAPPMAAFTVCVGLLRIGPALFGRPACVASAQVLWIAGAALSLASAFVVPYLMFTRHQVTTQGTFGSWLLPVVPPIVASVPAALLLPTWPDALAGSMLAIAYAMLGAGVVLAAILIAIFYARLLFHKVPAPALVPTMWIVVGPLGQSVAGFLALGRAAHLVWPELAHGLAVAGLAYGLVVWGFGAYWLAMAIAVTLRAVRLRMPFSLGWWAFTFPVGTLTVGTYGLYDATRAPLFLVAGAGLLSLLGAMWSLVAYRSLGHAAASLARGAKPLAAVAA